MAYEARVLLDSVGPNGVRLTTLEVTFPRFVLAEFNTHRQFCLDGDTKLYFDLPTKQSGSATRRFCLTIRDLYEKWERGAAPRINRYKTKSAASVAGYANYTGIGIRGRGFIEWIAAPGFNRQPMRQRVMAMDLRSCNEDTGEIYHTHIRNVVFSGQKPMFRVALKNGQTIVTSKDHRFLTREGWQTLERAVGLSLSSGKLATWQRSAEFAVNGIEAYEDPKWLSGMRDVGLSVPRVANYCGVSVDKVKYECRRQGIYGSSSGHAWLSHPEEPWNKGRRCSRASMGGLRLRRSFVPKRRRAMVRHFVELDSIEYVGERDAYDLEVEGPFHNFVADGFVVHNSRNSASSRAVPTARLIERAESDPVLPLEWGRNKAGMSASDVLSDSEVADAMHVWLEARDDAVRHAKQLVELKVHKQELNRILEPFLWHTVIVTATEWQNFFELRCAPNAQPEIRAAAVAMRTAMEASRPMTVALGAWHTPLVQPDEAALDVERRKRISAARCARVSYLTHDGRREIEKDLQLYERLREDRHLSPFEHVATPSDDAAFHANFRGWAQMRAEIELERKGVG